MRLQSESTMATLRNGSDSSQVKKDAASSTGSADNHREKSNGAGLICSQQVQDTKPQHGQYQRRPAEMRATGKIAMRDSREHVETLRRATDDFADELARDAR